MIRRLIDLVHGLHRRYSFDALQLQVLLLCLWSPGGSTVIVTPCSRGSGAAGALSNDGLVWILVQKNAHGTHIDEQTGSAWTRLEQSEHGGSSKPTDSRVTE